MSSHIRAAQAEDFPQILNLIHQLAAHIGIPEGCQNSVQQLEEDAEWFNCIVAATEEGEIIGIATYFFGYASWVGKTLYLDDLVLKDGWRRQGHGSSLFEAVIQLARQHKCKRLSWEVTKDNTSAQAFYKKHNAEFDRGMILCKIENFG